ncbi:MAG TPA: 16S rRNA (cytosine(1402)-N(4))-methyltransferase RsmH [Cyclobacteriaceae bacterium]
MEYHVPVMLKESIEGLALKADGIYLDLTFGGGGHSRAILKHIGNGRLIAFDQDADAKAQADKISARSFLFVNSNYRHCQKYLKLHGIDKVDGILADLGVSSFQINIPERGFSTRFEGPLDMRMNIKAALDARIVVNEYSEKELIRIFNTYGELFNARKIARAITSSRINEAINSTGDLKNLIYHYLPRGKENKNLAKVFQALRIEVNDELGALKALLEQSVELLSVNGRIVVLTYHSLEDRLVKNFFRKGNFEGIDKKDFYGKIIRPLEPVNNKPIIASQAEIKENPRARSAKLRIAEKI